MSETRLAGLLRDAAGDDMIGPSTVDIDRLVAGRRRSTRRRMGFGAAALAVAAGTGVAVPVALSGAAGTPVVAAGTPSITVHSGQLLLADMRSVLTTALPAGTGGRVVVDKAEAGGTGSVLTGRFLLAGRAVPVTLAVSPGRLAAPAGPRCVLSDAMPKGVTCTQLTLATGVTIRVWSLGDGTAKITAQAMVVTHLRADGVVQLRIGTRGTPGVDIPQQNLVTVVTSPRLHS